MEQVLFNEQVQIERKMFSFELRENTRGRFLRITEDVGGRRDTVIIPATGLPDVCHVIARALAAIGPADLAMESASVN